MMNSTLKWNKLDGDYVAGKGSLTAIIFSYGPSKNHAAFGWRVVNYSTGATIVRGKSSWLRLAKLAAEHALLSAERETP